MTGRTRVSLSGSVERGTTAVGLGAFGLFQLALATGAPWGRACYGGAHPRALPARLRAVSAGAALLYSGLAYAVASPRTPMRTKRRFLTGIAGVMGVATIVNGISPSLPERAIWTPASALLAVSAWRARSGT